jgi:hypothetical protein
VREYEREYGNGSGQWECRITVKVDENKQRNLLGCKVARGSHVALMALALRVHQRWQPVKFGPCCILCMPQCASRKGCGGLETAKRFMDPCRDSGVVGPRKLQPWKVVVASRVRNHMMTVEIDHPTYAPRYDLPNTELVKKDHCLTS